MDKRRATRLPAGELDGLEAAAGGTSSQRLSDALSRQLVEAAPVGIVRVDPRGRVLHANPAFARLVGADSPESLWGQAFADCFDEGSACRLREEILPDLGVDIPWSGRLDVMDGDGRSVATLSRLYALEGSNDHAGISVAIVSPTPPEHGLGTDAGLFAERDRTRVLLETVIRQSPTPVVLVSYPDMVIRTYNDASRAVLGIEDEPSYKGKRIDEFYPTWRAFALDGREIGVADTPLARALGGQRTHLEEQRIQRKDGSVRYIMVDAAPIYGEDGKRIAGLLSFPDITEKKRSEYLMQAQYELALRLGRVTDLESTLRACMDSLLGIDDMDGGGIYLVDERTGRIELAVSSGVSSAFAKAGECYDATSPNAQLVMKGEPVYLSAEPLDDLLGEVMGRDGMRSVVVLPIQNQGQVIGAINVGSRSCFQLEPKIQTAIETIASQAGSAIAHASAVEKLRQSEERYRHFVATASDGIYRMDFATPVPIALPDSEVERLIERGAIFGEVNETMARMYGCCLEDAAGHHARLFDADCGARGLRLVRSPGFRVFDDDGAGVGADGVPHYFTDSAVGVVKDGCLVRVWGTRRDVTARRLAEQDRARLEAQLRQSQKLEAIGQLTGGIAHDFNNIMTGINGYAELLLHRLPAGDPLRSDVQEIMRAGERAAGLTDQLLAFSRKQVIAPRVINPNEVLGRAKGMLCRVIGEDVSLEFRLAADLGRTRMDPAQLEQVLVNLVVNARDAVPVGGEILVETTNVTLGAEACDACGETLPGDYVLMSVRDDGCGMDTDTLSRVFEPFFTTKHKGKGTGLGLAMVHGAVHQNNGVISVDSEPNLGTTFKVYLPRVLDEEEPVGSRESSGLPAGCETVLLVEDDALVRALAKRVLQEQGYNVLEASDGEKAYAVSGEYEGSIELLLTDVVMPLMNGRELFERLAPLRPTMKVLYMSGYTANVIAKHGALEPGVELVSKPFSVEELTRRLREVIDGGSRSDEPTSAER